MRWTRIEEVVIMEWLIRETERGGPQLFLKVGPSKSCPGRFGVVTIPSTDFQSLTQPLVDVGSTS